MPDISFSCPYCGQVLEAPDEMAGQAVECPACQKEIAVPAAEVPASDDSAEEQVPEETVAEETQTEEAAAEEPLEAAEEEVEELAPASEPASGGSKCPECKAPMESGSVLCMRCGFHTKLGKKIKTSFG